jgi:hypothetical protein
MTVDKFPSSNPTALMTAAFAIGQLAGPLFSGLVGLLPVGHHAALICALQLAAATLVLSAAYRWAQSCHPSSD